MALVLTTRQIRRKPVACTASDKSMEDDCLPIPEDSRAESFSPGAQLVVQVVTHQLSCKGHTEYALIPST